MIQLGFEFEVIFPDMEKSSTDIMEKWIEYATANWEFETYNQQLEYFIDHQDNSLLRVMGIKILPELPEYAEKLGYKSGDDIPDPQEVFRDWRSRNSKMFRHVIRKNPFVKNLPYPYVLSYKESRKSKKEHIIKPDLSIGPQGLEMSTKVMREGEALDFCKEMFSYIDEYAATTDECGFHVSVSDTNKRKMRGLTIFDLLTTVNQKYIYRHFPKRMNSDYAKPWSHEHDGAINLEHLVDINNPYVEFRFIGGRDYHKKWKPVKNIVENYIESIERSI